jgi:hypothetical protein
MTSDKQELKDGLSGRCDFRFWIADFGFPGDDFFEEPEFNLAINSQ